MRFGCRPAGTRDGIIGKFEPIAAGRNNALAWWTAASCGPMAPVFLRGAGGDLMARSANLSEAKARARRGHELPVPDAAPGMIRVPFDLMPLVAPHKGKGRLTIRVERMPQLARLSAGQNNGDRSWSLTRDELDELTYLVPEGFCDSHTLAIRIVASDGVEATTLSLLDFPMFADGAGEAAAGRPVKGGSTIHRLHPGAPKGLGASGSDTSDSGASKSGISEEDVKARIAAELAAARAVWQAEHDAHLAAAAEELTAAVQAARCESENVLLEASAVWQREEAARLAAAETRWRARASQEREELEARLAEARCQAEASDAQWGARLDEERKAAKTALDARDAALSQMHLALRQLEERWQQRLATELDAAEKSWAAGETARREEAERMLRQQYEQRIAKAEAAAAGDPAPAAELESALARCGTLQKRLADCEGELANRESALEEARLLQARARQDAAAALAAAEAGWQAAEAARLTEKETAWRQQSAEALAEAVARAESAEAALAQARAAQSEPAAAQKPPGDDHYTESLNREIARLRTALVDREAALAHAHAELEAARIAGVADGPALPQLPAFRKEPPKADVVPRMPAAPRGSLLSGIGRLPAAVDARTLRLFAFATVAAGLVLAAVVLLPGIGTALTGSQDAPQAAAPVPAPPPAAAASPRTQTAFVTRPAALCGAPSLAGPTVAGLDDGDQVTILDRQGNWDRVRTTARGGKPLEGWVYAFYLDTAERPGAPAPRTGKARKARRH